MTCKHNDIYGTVLQNDEGVHIQDICRKCGAARTYTQTPDGMILGGYWIELQDGRLVVKEKGQVDGKDESD